MTKKNLPKLAVSKKPFGIMPGGQNITQYLLQNTQGITATVINYGATLVSLKVPDQQGKLTEITLGFGNLEDYLKHEFYFGATIGRVANRISHAQFNYENTRYQLSRNYQE